MATRREKVVLDVEDNLTPAMARAAVATDLAAKSLDRLDGTSTKAARSTTVLEKELDRSNGKLRARGREVDQFSGRLRLMTDAAVALGPALVPLGASLLPSISAGLIGLGAAAGGITAAVLAFDGLGDALKAIDTARLEPTAGEHRGDADRAREAWSGRR